MVVVHQVLQYFLRYKIKFKNFYGKVNLVLVERWAVQLTLQTQTSFDHFQSLGFLC